LSKQPRVIESAAMPLGPGTSELTPTMIDPPRAPVRIDTVRQQFDRRAADFSTHDVLVREVGRRLIERLAVIKLAPARVLDAGCGAGGARADLLARFPRTHWLGVDLSPAMLQAARAQASLRQRITGMLAAHWRGARMAPAALCADAGRLPLRAATVDLVFSNLMLHWHPAPHTVFPEFKRVLAVNGLLLFSCFGPDTLRELRTAYISAGIAARPMPFIDMHDFGDMMVAAGFATPVMDVEVLTLTYATPRALLADVWWLGGNPRIDRRAGLPSGARARAMLAALDARRDGDGRIALTIEVAYGHGWHLPAKTRGETVIALDDLRAGLPSRRR